MSKAVLVIVGIAISIMGIMALVDVFGDDTLEPTWHSWVKIIVGAVLVVIALMDKKKKLAQQ